MINESQVGTVTYRELTELRRPAGEKSIGELTADPRGRPFLFVARGVEAGPSPPSGPLRAPGTGVRGEETAGNMTELTGDTERASSGRTTGALAARGIECPKDVRRAVMTPKRSAVGRGRTRGRGAWR